MLPVVASLVHATGRLVASSQAVVRAGLQVLLAYLGRDGESFRVADARAAEIAASPAGLAEAVECFCLADSVAGLAEQRQSRIQAGDGLLVMAEMKVGDAEPGQGVGFTGPVAQLAAHAQGLRQLRGALAVMALAHVHGAEVDQGTGLTVPVAELPERASVC